MKEKAQIKIVIENFGGKKVLTQIKGENCRKVDILETLEIAYLGMMKDCSRKDMTEGEIRKYAKEFGGVMERELTEVMLKRKNPSQTLTGKEAEFLSVLMHEQEAQGE